MSGRTKRALLKYLAKEERREKNYQRNMDVYERGASALPKLIRDEPSDPARVEKIKAQAQARRERRSR